MNRSIRGLGAVISFALFALALTACIIRPNPNDPSGGGGGGGGGGGNPAIVVKNNSEGAICFVNFSSTNDNDWGGDQLGSSETISPGSSRTWTVGAGSYDVRLQDCSHNVLAERRGIAVQGPVEVAYP